MSVQSIVIRRRCSVAEGHFAVIARTMASMSVALSRDGGLSCTLSTRSARRHAPSIREMVVVWVRVFHIQ